MEIYKTQDVKNFSNLSPMGKKPPLSLWHFSPDFFFLSEYYFPLFILQNGLILYQAFRHWQRSTPCPTHSTGGLCAALIV